MTKLVTTSLRSTVGLATFALAVSVGMAVTSAPARADQTYYVPVTKTWTIAGHGNGHGHGLSQYGAFGAAQQGLNYTEITRFYYPGTSWATARHNVRVLISSDYTSDLQVRPQRGLTVRDMRDSKVWTLPRDLGSDMWRMTPAPDGSTAVQFHDRRGWHRWNLPGDKVTLRSDGQFRARNPLTLMVPGGSGVTPKRYRGILRSVRPYPGATVRDTVNVIPMDDYVQGVVPYEMSASWPQQALRSQAVAARTYAAWQRAQNPDRYYQICDTASCQVYGGVAAEQSSSNTAVQATARKILTSSGKPAFTQFSSSSGGWTSSGGVSYLPAKRDRYDGFAGNPVHSWSVDVSSSSLERAHPEIGRLVALRVTKRDGHGAWGGRVLQIKLQGSRRTAYLTGDDLRWQYGLRSSWFTIEPTPIIARWRDLGGEKSLLGSPTSGEHVVDSGGVQEFTGGRVFWSARTGAREVRGRLLQVYRQWGGPGSLLGWPLSGVQSAPNGGHKSKFQGGRIFAKSGPGAHVIYGPVLSRWAKAGYAAGSLGYPTTDVFAVDGGQRGRFQHGVITWHRASNTFTVKRTG